MLAASLPSGCRKNDVGCGAEAPAGYKVFIRPATTPAVGPAPGGPMLVSFDNGSYPRPCSLLTTLQRKGNVLRLNYCGVNENVFCNDVVGPARGRAYLRELPAQVYQLEIIVRNRCTTGTLDLTATPARLIVADTTVAAGR